MINLEMSQCAEGLKIPNAWAVSGNPVWNTPSANARKIKALLSHVGFQKRVDATDFGLLMLICKITP